MDLRQYFNEQIYPLNPAGDFNYDWSEFENLMSMHMTDNEGKELTPERFKQKYKEYIIYWDRVYLPKMKAGYLKGGDEKVAISYYIVSKMYMRTYEMPKENRDYYLFGDLSSEEMKQQHAEFMSKTKGYGT